MSLRRHVAWLVPVCVGALAQVFVLLRIADGPLKAYHAVGGTQYAAHVARLRVWAEVQRSLSGERPWLTLPWRVDGEYPPLVHVVTGLLVAPFDHALMAAMVTGMLWVALLAVGTGRVAGHLAEPDPDSFHWGASFGAATGVLLLGSLQGQSFRYYYDVPMTALLWLAAGAVLAHWDRRPVRAVVVGGLLFAGAGLAKWTALPFGGVLGLGLLISALTSGAGHRRRRAGVVLGAGTLASALCAGYVIIGLKWSPQRSFWSLLGARDWAQGPLQNLLDPTRLAFYPDHLVRTVLSPALGLCALLLVALWLVRSRRGAALLVVTVLGQLLWLIGWVRFQDERFILTAVPAIIVASALGWSTFAGRGQTAVGAAVVAVGVAVCADFHLGDRRLASKAAQVSARWGLDSAQYPQEAWARGDERGVDCAAHRAQIAALVTECGADAVALTVDDAPILSDGFWWSHLSALDAVLHHQGERTEALFVFQAIDTWSPPSWPHGVRVVPDLILLPLDLPGPPGSGLYLDGPFAHVADVPSIDCPESPGISAWRPASTIEPSCAALTARSEPTAP